MSAPDPGRRADAAANEERLRAGDFDVVLDPAHRPVDPARAVARLADPGAARRTLHWGRNYLYTVVVDTRAGQREVVVKQFRHDGLGARLRRRTTGSKAAKSWRAARALAAAGFHTPRPLFLVESRDAAGVALYVTLHLDHDFEARYWFRALNAGELGERFPAFPRDELLGRLGREARRLHDRGFWYRDLSAGNVLVRRGAGGELELHFVDLNRVRLDRRMPVARRMRDLCRLPIERPTDQRRLLAAYWGDDPARTATGLRLYRLFHRAFRLRSRLKDALRGPRRALAELLFQRTAHAHIPPAPTGASARDKVVWDHLSDQPHQHASRGERLRVRIADAGAHAEALVAAAGAAPRIWRRYRHLRRELHRRPVAWGAAGVAVRPWPTDPEALLEAIDELGVGDVLLRLHPWQEEHRAEEELARELAARGYRLAFALPQDRRLVRDPAAWRGAVEELAERFVPFGRSFQVGQAINRSKWGVWNYREYLELAAVADEVLRAAGDVELLGPAVIDFEYAATAAVLNMRRPGVRFDAVAALLYVDRRGAPENAQLGFDTVGKVTLLRAIAETAANAAGRCWITEVNWPLWEGPHSPAGRDVSVDEERQADYLARYYLQTLGTGLVERVYWWQLVARGYGLVDPADGSLRRRPGFRALATLARELSGATFEGPAPVADPGRLYLFTTGSGERLAIGWSAGEPLSAELPGPATAVLGRDGEEEAAADPERLELGSSPRYARLDRDG